MFPGDSGRRSASRCLLASASAALLATAAVQPSLNGGTTELAGGRLTIGAVRPGVSLIGAALAQVGRTVTLEDVTFESPSTTFRLPRIDFVGVSLSRDELSFLLDGKSAEPWPARLARLSAERIVIPNAIVEERIGSQSQTSTFRNVVASDVKEGRVTQITSEGIDLRAIGGPRGDLSGTAGVLAIRDLDLPAQVALYAERAGEQPGGLQRILGEFSLENVSLRDAAGLTLKIARASGRDLRARPTNESWRSLASAIDPFGRKTPDDSRKQIDRLAELYGAFDLGFLELSGLETRETTPGDDAALTVDRIASVGSATGQPTELSAEGLTFSGKNGGGRIGRVSFTGFSLASTLDGAKTLARTPAAQLDPDDLRKVIPTAGTIRMADLAFDMAPEMGNAPPNGTPERVRFGVGSVELKADKPINGIPTSFSSEVENITFPLPAASADDTVQTLLAMGYRSLDLSFASAADWVEGSSELQVRELSLRGAAMGGISLRGTIGNVTRDAFDPDPAVAAVALLGATARSLEITVEDKGLAERLLAREAQRLKTSPDALRREYGVAAAVGVPALLGNSASSKSVAQAIARFLAKPGRLVIAAKAKEPDGLGVADLAALGDPASILEKVDLSARAE